MSASTRKLRLRPLPKTDSVKITFTCPLVLKAELERYAHYIHCQGVPELSQLLCFRGGNQIWSSIGRETVFHCQRVIA